ncbi:amidase [Brevibacterium sanguinis]|uniref:Amidase n=2 Tax=Brevibacterium TaxID=1696 RepID=A0A366IJ59_9MICO|nr:MULTISPECIES: amidase family protein [Brevibacterium]RBP64916.1 amidase [Brevibacterium sanguinis]RBP71179.1 amidase [Brevibacterium celere]
MNNVHELGARAMVELTRSGEISASDLLEAHLERIDAHNADVNAIVALDVESAREQAKALDALPVERRGRLHGLPVAIKDTANAVGFPATSGHRHFADFRPEADDLHVARMRAEGVVIIGKTNVPEMAAGSHSFNKVYGTTYNPHDPARSAGGSSGGAAAALAAGFVPIADGSDMGGSLRNPAAFCGVVGMRPSPGVIVGAEHPNMGDRLVTVGPMARTVADTALLLDVMAGPTEAQPQHVPLDSAALQNLEPARLEGMRVAYAPDLDGRVPVDPEITSALDALVARLESAGATIVRSCPNLDGADEAFRTLRAAEFQSTMGELLTAEEENFNDFLADNIRQGESLTALDVMRALQTTTRLSREAADFFADVDLVLAPTTQILPFPAEQTWPREVAGQPMGDYLEWMRSAWLFTPLGLPGISIPAGFAEAGLPIGVQLLAGPGRDVELLQSAAAIEALIDLGYVDPFARDANRDRAANRDQDTNRDQPTNQNPAIADLAVTSDPTPASAASSMEMNS